MQYQRQSEPLTAAPPLLEHSINRISGNPGRFSITIAQLSLDGDTAMLSTRISVIGGTQFQN